MNAELFEALELLEKTKGIPVSYMLEKVEAALQSAFKKEYGTSSVRVAINREKKDMRVYRQCAVHASSGLKDGTCPPHTNFAPFNNLNTEDKVMIVAPEMGHSYPANWEKNWKTFFSERIK